MKISEIEYEPEVEPDADIIQILLSRTLRSLPLENTMKQIKLTQPGFGSRIKTESQRTIFEKINKDSRSLWGSY